MSLSLSLSLSLLLLLLLLLLFLFLFSFSLFFLSRTFSDLSVVDSLICGFSFCGEPGKIAWNDYKCVVDDVLHEQMK